MPFGYLQYQSGTMKQTGIFSGSFNPIHIGHLALANYLCEFEGLDEVWFLVSPHNPLKEKEELMDDQFRYELTCKAIDGYPKSKASDFEFSLPQPSYTIQTLNALRVAFPDNNFQLIIGADNWQVIDQWKNYKELLTNYSILIYPRKGYEAVIPATCPNVRLVQAPMLEISSTFIREALREGKDIRFFLPEGIRNML